MEAIIATVILTFFALVGICNLLAGMGEWISRTGALTGAVLVVPLPESAETAEAALQEAVDWLNFDKGLNGIRLGVICPPGSPAREIGELFCQDRGVTLAADWEELGGLM